MDNETLRALDRMVDDCRGVSRERAALLQVQSALAAERDGMLPDGFTWEEFKYNVVDPACGNDPDLTEYDPDYMGIASKVHPAP